jgi:hypothetical protein
MPKCRTGPAFGRTPRRRLGTRSRWTTGDRRGTPALDHHGPSTRGLSLGRPSPPSGPIFQSASTRASYRRGAIAAWVGDASTGDPARARRPVFGRPGPAPARRAPDTCHRAPREKAGLACAPGLTGMHATSVRPAARPCRAWIPLRKRDGAPRRASLHSRFQPRSSCASFGARRLQHDPRLPPRQWPRSARDLMTDCASSRPLWTCRASSTSGCARGGAASSSVRTSACWGS